MSRTNGESGPTQEDPVQASGDRSGPAQWAELDGHRVAFEIAGDGTRTLVLLHGANADRAHWHRQLAAPPKDTRLVAIDLIGHGESDAPPPPHSMNLHARAVLAVMDELELAHAVIAGHSNGALVARQLLRLAPERVRALVILDCSFAPTLSPPMVEWMRSTLERPDYESFLGQMFDSMPKGALAPKDIEVLRAAFVSPKETSLGWLDAITDEAIWDEDPIEVPTLLVTSSTPPHGTEVAREQLRRLAPEAEVHVWDGVTHFLMMERPEELASLLIGLLDRLEDT